MDWEDDLLALAEAPAPKKKKKQKKRKRELSNSDDDMDISAGSDEELKPVKGDEDNEDDAEHSDAEEVLKGPRAYPLEGLYKNAEDKAWLMDMTELDREQILDERRTEIERYNNQQILKQMVAGGSGKKDEDSDSDEAYSRPSSSRRKPATAKAKQLDELKRRRKAKSERDEKRARRREEGEESDDENRPHALRTDFSWSSDDDEPEEGEEEEDDDDVYGGSKAKADKKKRAGKEKEVEAATKDDLQRIVIRRGRLAEFWPCSFFSDYVEDAYVRIGVGQNKGERVYRLAKIVRVAPNRSSRGYKLDRHTTNVKLTLAIGKDKRDFTMEMVSNDQVTDREYDRFIKTLQAAQMDPPTKKDVEDKRKVLDKYRNYTLTESDINTIIKTKKDLARGGGDIHHRHTLLNRRDIALRSGDAAALAAVDKEIEEYDARHGRSPASKAQGNNPLTANGSNSSLDKAAVPPSGPLTLEDRRKHLAAGIGLATPRALAAKQNVSQAHRPGSGATTPQRQAAAEGKKPEGTAPGQVSKSPAANSSSSAPGHQTTRFQDLLAAANLDVDLGDF